jgi:hypothetical protein
VDKTELVLSTAPKSQSAGSVRHALFVTLFSNLPSLVVLVLAAAALISKLPKTAFGRFGLPSQIICGNPFHALVPGKLREGKGVSRTAGEVTTT